MTEDPLWPVEKLIYPEELQRRWDALKPACAEMWKWRYYEVY